MPLLKGLYFLRFIWGLGSLYVFLSLQEHSASEVVGHSTQNVKWFFKNVQPICVLLNYITLYMSFTNNAIMFVSISVRGWVSLNLLLSWKYLHGCSEFEPDTGMFHISVRYISHWQCLGRGGRHARRHSWHFSAGLIAEFLADYRQTAPSETLTSPSQERCVCVSPGSLVDLDSTNSNSAAPTNTTATTASSDLWGDFDPVSSKWRESPSVSLPLMSL